MPCGRPVAPLRLYRQEQLQVGVEVDFALGPLAGGCLAAAAVTQTRLGLPCCAVLLAACVGGRHLVSVSFLPPHPDQVCVVGSM